MIARHLPGVEHLVTILAALVGVAAAQPLTERVVTGDGIVRVRVNGVEGRLRIDPGATAMPMINAKLAARAGLKPGMLAFGFLYAVGPERVGGATAVGRIDYGGGAGKQRIGWTKRRYAADADGVAGPGSVPEPFVRFALRPPVAGERVTTFRMIDQGGLFGDWAERFAVIEVGGQPMRLRFDPHHPRTLATAGAGVRLAAAHDGRMAGQVTREEIAFGIARPVRTMTLARPLTLGPLAIARLGVRTADHGSADGIPDADAPPPDPDEIVVVAGRKRDPARDRLSLGADVLARCSSIVFDKPGKVVRLSCA